MRLKLSNLLICSEHKQPLVLRDEWRVRGLLRGMEKPIQSSDFGCSFGRALGRPFGKPETAKLTLFHIQSRCRRFSLEY